MGTHIVEEFEPPNFIIPKKKSKTWLYILIVVALAVAAYFYFNPAPVETIQEFIQEEFVSDAPEEVVAEDVPEKPVITSTAPPMDLKCDIVAGVIPGTVKREGNVVSVVFKNNGKKVIEGSYFEFSFEDKKAYRQNTESLQPAQEVSYSVDLNDASIELGSAARSFVILPVQGGKACVNQRMVVIESSNLIEQPFVN